MQNQSNILEPYGAFPSERQINWQAMEMYAFLHFTVNTFTGREWGDGTENPELFQPSELDCEQWCRIISENGFKGAIITAKHHDGFCLWQTKYTDHSVASTSWRNGKGDVVADFICAAKKYALKIGIYLSPWDRHEKSYGTDAYNDFYCNQLCELVNMVGNDLFMIWWDGACGEGPNGKKQIYDFPRWIKLVRELAPQAVIFGDVYSKLDIRWCGNESGFAGEKNYPTITDNDSVCDTSALHEGLRGANHWMPAEVDVSIRPGWFYHEEENCKLHSIKKLVDIWFHSVGRGSCLNLNLPPDKSGLIHPNDEIRLTELKTVLDTIFKTDFIKHSLVQTIDEMAPEFTAKNLTDGSPNTFWMPSGNVSQPEIIFELGQMRKVNVFKISEYTQLGLRVSGFEIEYCDRDGIWNSLASGQVIGIRRILRTKTVETNMLKLKITGSDVVPCIQEFGAYYQPPLISPPEISRDKNGIITVAKTDQGTEIYYTLDGSVPNNSSPHYTTPFTHMEAGTIRAVSIPNDGDEINMYPGIRQCSESVYRFGVARKDWIIMDADSENRPGTSKDELLDGDKRYIFWLSADTPYPHWVLIDTGKKQSMHGFIMTPGDNRDAIFGSCRFYVGDTHEKQDVFAGEFTFDNIMNNPVAQYLQFESPVEGRYIRFEMLNPLGKTSLAGFRKLEIF